MRADQLLVARGLAASRSQAQRLIASGARWQRAGQWQAMAKSDDIPADALVEIIDRGPGIPAPHQRQLFEPFFTTRADGTGLGLYICKQLLGANQGSIEYVNVPGGGSCFRIQLAVPQRDLA